MRQNRIMDITQNTFNPEKINSSNTAKEEVKHFALRLPSAPDFKGERDESGALTRLRAMTELLSGKRYTVHATICELIESAAQLGYALPFPKSQAISSKQSMERFDLRLTQKQIDLLDALRDQFKPPPGVIDYREYYNRSDIVRELIKLESKRVEVLFKAFTLS